MATKKRSRNIDRAKLKRKEWKRERERTAQAAKTNNILNAIRLKEKKHHEAEEVVFYRLGRKIERYANTCIEKGVQASYDANFFFPDDIKIYKYHEDRARDRQSFLEWDYFVSRDMGYETARLGWYLGFKQHRSLDTYDFRVRFWIIFYRSKLLLGASLTRFETFYHRALLEHFAEANHPEQQVKGSRYQARDDFILEWYTNDKEDIPKLTKWQVRQFLGTMKKCQSLHFADQFEEYGKAIEKDTHLSHEAVKEIQEKAHQDKKRRKEIHQTWLASNSNTRATAHHDKEAAKKGGNPRDSKVQTMTDDAFNLLLGGICTAISKHPDKFSDAMHRLTDSIDSIGLDD